MLVCLVIMIKDGKSVIGPTLEAAMPYMDAWFVFDTGSTDGTQQYIRQLMQEKFPDKPGALMEEPFINFEVSRSRALHLARRKFPTCTFQMMLDDSYILHGGAVLRAYLQQMTKMKNQAEGYMIMIGEERSRVQYPSARIFRTTAQVVYEGVVHEVPTCDASDIVPNPCYIEDGYTETTRERSRRRYQRDLSLLLPEVKAKRGNHTRNVFYLAQTYECLEQWDKALEWYQKRVDLADDPEHGGGYHDEIYMSYLRMGRRSWKKLQRPWSEAQHYFLQGEGRAAPSNPLLLTFIFRCVFLVELFVSAAQQAHEKGLAHQVCPHRWEAPYKIANHYYKEKQWTLCYAFASLGEGSRRDHPLTPEGAPAY